MRGEERTRYSLRREGGSIRPGRQGVFAVHVSAHPASAVFGQGEKNFRARSTNAEQSTARLLVKLETSAAENECLKAIDNRFRSFSLGLFFIPAQC